MRVVITNFRIERADLPEWVRCFGLHNQIWMQYPDGRGTASSYVHFAEFRSEFAQKTNEFARKLKALSLEEDS